MTKEELLEKAKRDYPIGTVFNPAHLLVGTGECQYKQTVEGYIDLSQQSDDRIEVVSIENSWVPNVYYKGKWAEIISLPEKRCPFKIGDVLECLEDHHGGPKKGEICIVKDITPDGMTFKDRNSTHSNYESFKLSSKILIFNDIYVGDVVVSITGYKSQRSIGDMFTVLPKSINGRLYYKESEGYTVSKDWRKATPEEEEAYNKGIRNIKDIPAPVKAPKFEVGKWYKRVENMKWTRGCLLYMKVLSYSPESQPHPVRYSERIDYEDGYYKSIADCMGKDWELADLSEIQQYLPEGHVDKIKKEIPLIEGKYYKDDDIIIKIIGGREHGIRISSKAFARNNFFVRKGILKEASLEEGKWLDKCLEATTFISKEEALKPVSLIGRWVKVVGSSTTENLPTGSYHKVRDDYDFQNNNTLFIENKAFCLHRSEIEIIPEGWQPPTELTEFPSDGQCIPADLRIAKYLVSRPNTKVMSGSAKYEEAKGIAWNSSSHWYFVASSGKKEYKLEELEKFLPKLEAMENWCVKITPENREIVKKWGNTIDDLKGKSFSMGAFYGWINGRYNAHTDESWCIPITTEEFYKKIGHVEAPATPEYVEALQGAISWFNAHKGDNPAVLTKGKIYKFPDGQDDNGKSYSLNKNFSVWEREFKPSTKEAYEAQNKPKYVPAVGDWVLVDNYTDKYNGKIVKITRINEDSKYCWFEPCESSSHNFCKSMIVRKAELHEIPKTIEKEPELIEGQWYEGLYKTSGKRHIFRLLKIKGLYFHVDKYVDGDLIAKRGNWEGFAGKDNWNSLKSANMEEVYKHFPEERPKEKEINTYGLKVGDKLSQDALNKWVIFDPFDKKWVNYSSFCGDRTILSFIEEKGIVGFEISGCRDKWLGKAEGFKEFMENFNKPKTVELSSLPEKWCIKITDENVESLHYFKESKRKDPLLGPKCYKKWQGYSFVDHQGYGTNQSFGTEITFEQFKKWVLKEQPKEKVMKYKIGDNVTILNIKNYQTDGHPARIPREKMIHGSATLHSNPNAKIVDIYNEYYIVNFINDHGNTMQLGFLEKDITLREENHFDGKEFKVGDWIYTNDNSGGWGMMPNDENKVFQIKAVGEESGKFTLDGNSCNSTKTTGTIRVRIQDVRKALPHEIPPYNTIYDKGLVEEMVHFSQGYDQLRPKKKGFDEKEHLSKPYNQMLTVKIKKTNKTKTKQLFL